MILLMMPFFSSKNFFDSADQLSKFATYFGRPELVNEQADRHRRVTAAEVTRFARERLGSDNRASLLFVPRKQDEGAVAESREPRAESDVEVEA